MIDRYRILDKLRMMVWKEMVLNDYNLELKGITTQMIITMPYTDINIYTSESCRHIGKGQYTNKKVSPILIWMKYEIIIQPSKMIKISLNHKC